MGPLELQLFGGVGNVAVVGIEGFEDDVALGGSDEILECGAALVLALARFYGRQGFVHVHVRNGRGIAGQNDEPFDPQFRACFELECRAVRKVRERMGLSNVEIMVPFVRTVGEAKSVIELLAECGLRRGENGLRVIMMCELPSNALLAEDFLEHFDGMSIGSNDMTQLTLGLDRDSGQIAALFDERDPAVLRLLEMAISACRKHGKYIGICGQGPSDHPDLARWLIDQGIETISLNPDTVVDTWSYLARELGIID
jgi:phosphoenolpyruvate synthase/pyruvate phosphate dikinase